MAADWRGHFIVAFPIPIAQRIQFELSRAPIGSDLWREWQHLLASALCSKRIVAKRCEKRAVSKRFVLASLLKQLTYPIPSSSSSWLILARDKEILVGCRVFAADDERITIWLTKRISMGSFVRPSVHPSIHRMALCALDRSNRLAQQTTN